MEGDEERMDEALRELAGPKFALYYDVISLSDETPALGALEYAGMVVGIRSPLMN